MPPARTPKRSAARLLPAVLLLLAAAGCARYNTFYNAEKAFSDAEHVREERIKAGDDVTKPTNVQVQDYRRTIQKCQKLLENYPGHSLSDDALFLMGKSHHRLQEYNASIEQLDLLFTNFPTTPYAEEALFLQAANHMFNGNVDRSNDYLEQLRDRFPESRFQAEALRVRGENAFALERWETARESYAAFVDTHPDDERAGEVGLELGQALWRLGEYGEAARRLEAAAPRAREREDAFLARLLRARSLIRLGQTQRADSLLNAVSPEAAVHDADGMVAVARAELQLAEGDADGALSTLTTIPDAWLLGDVAYLAGELRGALHLERWELEEAAEQYRIAARGGRVLEDPEGVKRLDRELARYITSEDRLDAATAEERPDLLLTQANVLLFTLDRPRLALDRYLEVAEAAEADSLAAVRGLYGAVAVYRDRLGMPDSASVHAERLLATYPESPQALVLSEGGQVDLYARLLAREKEAALLALAAESDTSAARPGPEATAPDRPRPGPELLPDDGGRRSYWRLRKLERNRNAGLLSG